MRKLYILLAAMFLCAHASAQVTTSSISGNVSDNYGEPLVGATVVALHTQSGTTYGTVVDNRGFYRIVNMRPGGPYRITIHMLGYKQVVTDDVNIPLGENYVFSAALQEDALGIDEVVVRAEGTIMNSDRTGASTNVNQKQIQTLPSLTRSITDFTRLTPQAGNSGTFGGRDTRYNNITIDGAAFSQRFGLSTSNNLPGGDAQPISLDAIQEISVNLTPFDIRQSNFTGANINAVTKGGTNKFTASVYTFLRPEKWNGDKIEKTTVSGARDSFRKSYGLSVGGPIIKNKLFFFVNGELEDRTYPGNSWLPRKDGQSPSNTDRISTVTEADMKRVYDHLVNTYNYNPGSYNTIDEFSSENYKIFARLDWNINNNHKVMVRYNMVNSTNDVITNSSSVPSGSGYINGNGRNSLHGRTFGNSYYGFENKVHSLTGEWNATFGPKVQNKLLASYTNISDMRTSPGQTFPFVDILDGSGNYYMSFGTELFSYNNGLENKTFNVTNNTTISLGAHTLTVGLSYENQFFSNGYMREGTTYYRYASVDAFLNNEAPTVFAYALPYDKGGTPRSELTFGLASAYLQDEWNVTRNLKLTAGLRVELPIFYTDLPGPTQMNIGGTLRNVSDLTFVDDTRLDLSKWSKEKILFSPRVGFNWDVFGDKSFQVRGGTGIFTGMLPFVWFTNQPQNAGFIQTPEIVLTSGLDNIRFTPDYWDQVFNNPNITPPTAGVAPRNSNLAKVDDDFKLPQLWRSSLAADVKLPWNMVFTLEGMYSKDINAVMQKNVNLPNADRQYDGADNRPYYSTNKIYSEISTAMLLTNTKKGYQTSVTAQLNMNNFHGFSGMIAYTWSLAKDVSANPGSAANSAWTANSTYTNMNDPELSYSAFSMPHRVVGYVSYTAEWRNHARTTISLYYNGIHSGRLSYVFANDANGDNVSGDLIYIPKDVSEMNFVDRGTYTAEQQQNDFEEFINNTSYLKKNRGKYAERYGDTQPWSNRFDLKIVQDVFTNFGTDDRYTLQLSLDIINIGNLINKDWGASYFTNGLQSYERMQVLRSSGVDSFGRLAYTLNATSTDDFKSKTKWNTSASTTNTWGIQLGIRLLF